MREIEVVLLYGLNLNIKELAINEPCYLRKLILTAIDEIQLPIFDTSTHTCKGINIDATIMRSFKESIEYNWLVSTLYEIFTKFYSEAELRLINIEVYKNYTIIKLKE